jgi:hypothetical protein
MMSLSFHAQALSDSLARAGLVPGRAATVIPRDFRPSTQLSILFGGKQVDLGNLFRVTEVSTAPSVQFDPEVCRLFVPASGNVNLLTRASDAAGSRY